MRDHFLVEGEVIDTVLDQYCADQNLTDYQVILILFDPDINDYRSYSFLNDPDQHHDDQNIVRVPSETIDWSEREVEENCFIKDRPNYNTDIVEDRNSTQNQMHRSKTLHLLIQFAANSHNTQINGRTEKQPNDQIVQITPEFLEVFRFDIVLVFIVHDYKEPITNVDQQQEQHDLYDNIDIK